MSDNTNAQKPNSAAPPSSSTLQSVVDSATGAVQSAYNTIVGGDSADKLNAEQTKAKASQEDAASHATLKGPGFTATAAGVTKDNPDRSAGSWAQTIGSAKETIGGLVGSEQLKAAGTEQRQQGEEREARGLVSDYASGVTDRVQGTVGSAVAGLTGNDQAKAAYDSQHDSGKTTQRGAEHDVSKKADAQAQVAADKSSSA